MSTIKATAAQLYLENSLLQKDHADELMSMLSVPYMVDCLDLGCGTGHLATILSDFVGPEGQVVAVDPDAERIKIANRENSRPNIEYSVANDQTFPGQLRLRFDCRNTCYSLDQEQTSSFQPSLQQARSWRNFRLCYL